MVGSPLHNVPEEVFTNKIKILWLWQTKQDLDEFGCDNSKINDVKNVG